MKKLVRLGLLFGVSVAALAFYAWPHLFDIRTYTVEELVSLTCQELSEKHEEVIFAYHDASIARYDRTDSFGNDLGLPEDDVLPFVIMMKKVIQDNDLSGFDLTKPFFQSAATATPKMHSDFYAEASSVCATNPTMDAAEAVVLAAMNLGLMRPHTNP
jgi:hypothetical protein